MKPARLFHPTDFSTASDVALRFALETAKSLGAELLVGHVVQGSREDWNAPPREDDRKIEVRLREHVAKVASAIDGRRSVDVKLDYRVSRHETPAAGIHHFASEMNVDVVVMGTHGRTGIRRLLLGGVAFQVLHRIQHDLVLVPSDWKSGRDGRILVPLDLHERSAAAVRLAAELARSFGSAVDLLYVLDVPAVEQLRGDLVMGSELSTLTEVALDRLARLAEDADPDLLVATHVSTGHPASGILRHVSDHHVGLVVMPGAGMSPAEHLRRYPKDTSHEDLRWQVSRVTQRVAGHTTAAVWVMKHFPDEEEVRSGRSTRQPAYHHM